MARVGVIVVSYATDPTPLFNSIAPSVHDVHWYIFVHGQDRGLRAKLDVLATATNSRYFPYGINRGLGRSWNEGLRAAFADGNDATIILNDDLFFYDGGFDQFVDFILSTKDRVPNFGMIMLYGMEPRGVGYSSAGEKSLRRILTVGACFSIGSGAIERVGYFDENFWPAYFEDFDYHYRLSLTGAPIFYDQRALLEHQRSATVRNDRLLSRLHHDRLRRTEKYYIQKWGGRPDQEMFLSPFNREGMSCFISAEQRAAASPGEHDRTDLGSSASAGLLEESFTEELLLALGQHAGSVSRCLEWAAGESTAIFAEYARMKGVEYLLSIDHDADRLRRTAAELPRYPFIHLRHIGLSDLGGPEDDIDYVSYPGLLGVRFDVILIAGRRRTDCVLFAPALLADDGLLVVTNEDSARHRAMHRLVGMEQSAAQLAAIDQHEQVRLRLLDELYDVVKESRQFLVLRSKQRREAEA